MKVLGKKIHTMGSGNSIFVKTLKAKPVEIRKEE